MIENTPFENLIHVLDLFDSLGIRYWLDGGWGVDALYGKATRKHRDIDIDFDAACTEQVLRALSLDGYHMETDELPVRAELYSSQYGYIDIHPFEIGQDGSIRQVNPEGGYFEFESQWFGNANFMGRVIPCISLSGQFVFHSGYELREKDQHDLRILNLIKEKIKICKHDYFFI